MYGLAGCVGLRFQPEVADLMNRCAACQREQRGSCCRCRALTDTESYASPSSSAGMGVSKVLSVRVSNTFFLRKFRELPIKKRLRVSRLLESGVIVRPIAGYGMLIPRVSSVSNRRRAFSRTSHTCDRMRSGKALIGLRSAGSSYGVVLIVFFFARPESRIGEARHLVDAEEESGSASARVIAEVHGSELPYRADLY